ncbi:MAG: hypothetical protein NTX15_10935 [Candidatus Kapabacteria bacterium]|nr:hypothetical protein [Candidatus Kapabacteria bacterium]
MRLVIILASILTIAGCASGPKVYKFENSRSMPLSAEFVHEKASTWLAMNGFVIITKTAELIVAQGSLNQLQGYETSAWSGVSIKTPLADCGSTGVVDFIATDATINVITQQTNTQAGVLVRVVMSPRRAEGTCNSNGVLEKMILDHLAN